MAEVKHKFKEAIETQLAGHIFDNELSTATSNSNADIAEFESYIDLIDSVRSEKNYDWQSDIRIPEFISYVLTQLSIDVAQYFQTRDFVEVYLEDESDEALKNADASKELINRALNQRHLNHYSKFVRAKALNNITGRVFIRCWWEQELKRGIVDYREKVQELDVDEYGNKIVDPAIQVPAKTTIVEAIEGDIPVIDRFNYDILDQRNVFTDNKYVYTLQEKDWIIIRFEKTRHELEMDSQSVNYFNLDLLKEIKSDGETETSKESYNKYTSKQKENNPVDQTFDIYERYGKYWCKVIKRDELTGEAIEVEPGIDENGEPPEDAELHEVIISHAVKGNTRVLVRFELTPYIDAEGNPYRPLIRGLCYIHPTDDGGTGDGKYMKEIQIAIDDTFNLGNDRVLFATMPVLKGRKYAVEDNSSIYFEPGHTMMLENPDDIKEFTIQDNIIGAMNQISYLTNKGQQVTSIFPTTMGNLPAKSSTTATAIAGAEQRSNIRSNYKSMTFENTALTELYWMIQQMTWRFAKPETGKKLMGDKVYDFNPKKDYYYKPLSQSIETDQSKTAKEQRLTQILGYVSQIQHPDTVKLVNYLVSRILTYMGDEFVNFGDKLLNPKHAIQGGPKGVQNPPAVDVASNQAGVVQSQSEQMTREVANAGV